METGRDADPRGEECLGKIEGSCLVFGFVLGWFFAPGATCLAALVGMWKSLAFFFEGFSSAVETVEKSP